MFTTIVITKPEFIERESERIAEMLISDIADIVHIRKPNASQEEVEQLIELIPENMYCRLVLHDHHCLAVKYGLYGIHLNGRNPFPPVGWTGSISRSCHSLQEVMEWKGRCNYVSLSPIYDSISKQGYSSAFTTEEIIEAANNGVIDRKVFALGGITFQNIPEIKRLGFGGGMILGDAWR